MSVKVKRGKWLVGIFENSNHKFEPRFTDNKEAAFVFDDLNSAAISQRRAHWLELMVVFRPEVTKIKMAREFM